MLPRHKEGSPNTLIGGMNSEQKASLDQAILCSNAPLFYPGSLWDSESTSVLIPLYDSNLCWTLCSDGTVETRLPVLVGTNSTQPFTVTVVTTTDGESDCFFEKHWKRKRV